MGFMSGELPGHSETGIHLHSRNVLVFLELGHGVRSCIIIDLSILLGTQRIHMPF